MNLLNDMIITDIEMPVVVQSKKGQTFQMNDRQCYGLSLCINGQITYVMNGKKFISDPGNAVLLPEGGSYTLFRDKEGQFPLFNFKCKNYNYNEIKVFRLENPSSCIKDFETIKNMFLYNESRLKIYSAFYQLLSKVATEGYPQQRLLRGAVHYIERNIMRSDLSNSLLAKQLGISEVYLRKLFAAYCQKTPKQYILDIRLKKAKQLLSDTAITVTSVSEECGFSSLYHFCRVFKNKTGMTPTEYANLNTTYQI